jgi:NADH:ubiquinone oxidoreductase subunit 5 (subunit L)/multisubunit Na+/H+ antiporter MnhA subunit
MVLGPNEFSNYVLDIFLPLKGGNEISNWLQFILTFNILYLVEVITYFPVLLFSLITNLVSLDISYSFFEDLTNFETKVYVTAEPDLTMYYYILFEYYFAWQKEFFSFIKSVFIDDLFYREFTQPYFIYCGYLFIFSTIISFIMMSHLGLYGVFILNLITIIMFWLSTVIYIDDFFLENYSFKINFGKWFSILLSYDVYFELFIDSISYSFMLLTISIATFVYIYVFSYFRYDANVERLILFINSFVISMIILVTSGNFFVMFLGWELIGLTSFMLINFWSTRMSTLKSAFKAYTFNKFSDVCILIGVILCFITVNDVNITVFNNQISLYVDYYITIFNTDISVIELISFFFISSAFVKSAQFGGHIWLPDSMEAPVPASALIHSATLVSAGVFLLLRLTPLFELSHYAYIVIPLVGSFTAFFGGLCAAYQSDIKRILAYSTISHCGFLMVCFSTYVPEFTILYLYIHGFFKASVFLCAGNIIRFSRNYQDFRRMGGFWKYLPFECFCSFICLINLSGLPFTIGFYIKHLILIGAGLDIRMLNFILINILGGAVFGIIYSYKFFYYVFFDIKKAHKTIYMQANRSILKSYYYSNTSLAANIAISGLIIVSYTISLYLLHMFLNHTSIGEGLDIYSIYNTLYYEFSIPTNTLLNNIGYFNWLLIIIIVSVCITSWRNVHDSFNLLKLFNFILVSSIFFYLFYVFLTI